MAIVKAVSSKASIGKAIKYVTKPEKTEEKLISGIDCNPQTAIQEMMATKEIWNKTNGRQYKHYVHSFKPEEKITPEKAHELAKELCENRFKGHEILIATHIDRKAIHSHIIVNSVNYETGYKIHRSKHDLEQMKKDSDELCRKNGLSITVKGENSLRAYDMKKYKAIEKDLLGKGRSYVFECYRTVKEVKKQAINKKDFISKMKDKGYETNWTDNRKYITFSNIERKEKGEKKYKIRNSNLEKTFDKPFGKEDLKRGFERNDERRRTEQEARKQLDRARNIDNEAGTGDTDTIIENINQSIRNARDAVGTDESQRRDRYAKEESIKCEQDRVRKQKAIERNSKSIGFER